MNLNILIVIMTWAFNYNLDQIRKTKQNKKKEFI